MNDISLPEKVVLTSGRIHVSINLAHAIFKFDDIQKVLDALDGTGNKRGVAFIYSVDGDTVTIADVVSFHNRHKQPAHYIHVPASEIYHLPKRPYIFAHSHPKKWMPIGPSVIDLQIMDGFYGAVFHSHSRNLTFFRRNGDVRTLSLQSVYPFS